jgi:hypothetical protein
VAGDAVNNTSETRPARLKLLKWKISTNEQTYFPFSLPLLPPRYQKDADV